MSVVPLTYIGDQVVIEHNGHTSQIPVDAIQFQQEIDGATSYKFVIIDCPVCGSASTHPVGGGAAPANIQELFARLYAARNCPCGFQITSRNLAIGKSHAKMHAEQMDGKGRWKLDGVPLV